MVTNSQPNIPPGQPTSRRVQEAFEALDNELLLDSDERNDAQKFHKELTKHLKEKGIIKDAFLQGSFVRKTMLKPLRDVDKVVIFHDDYIELKTAVGGAERAADLVETALREFYPNATYERTRHSIKLDLGEDTFSFDVVPAFEVDDESGDVWIMDRDNDSWKQSNTRELIKVVAARNAECDGTFIHQVRFAKFWVQKALGNKISGLDVESIAYTCIDAKLGHAEAMERIVTTGARLLGLVGYTDPTGVDRLSDKIDRDDRLAARAVFERAVPLVNEAVSLALAGRDKEAIAKWSSLFGESIEQVSQPEKGFLQSLGTGASVAAGIGSAAHTTTPTRAWAPE
jgi:predicted nucleotidyltransferase